MGDSGTLDDWYEKEIIGKGDEGSELLKSILHPSIQFGGHGKIVGRKGNAVPVVYFDNDEAVVTVIATAERGIDPFLRPEEFGASVVKELDYQARSLGGELRSMVNVVDTPGVDNTWLRAMANGMLQALSVYQIPNTNGENAIIPPTVPIPNLMGVGIAAIPRRKLEEIAGAFEHNGLPVYGNSDGIGSKILLHIAAGIVQDGMLDMAAMTADDADKVDGDIGALVGLAETNGTGFEKYNFVFANSRLQRALKAQVNVQPHYIGEQRLKSYAPDVQAWNFNGATFSLVDPDRLQDPRTPKDGETLLAIKGNMRSNGFSWIIPTLEEYSMEMFGKHWYESRQGRRLANQLRVPSQLFYPAYRKLSQSGAINWRTHLSGGSMQKRVHEAFVEMGYEVQIEELHDAPEAIQTLLDFKGRDTRFALGKFAYGNEGFATTDDPERAIREFEKYGLEAKAVGTVYQSDNPGVTVNTSEGVINFRDAA